MPKFPYQDPALSVHERAMDLLGRLSVAEKVGQVNQHLYGWQCYERSEDGSWSLAPALREHVAWGGGMGALYGLFRADPWSKVDYDSGVPARDAWKLANDVQAYVIEHSRWGIPALFSEECPHGHQGLDGIAYPTNIGRGNSFDPDLAREAASLMGDELACKGVHLALVSTLDLARDPRWGRTEECFGEDPLLAARMSAAIVDGFQCGLAVDDAAYEAPAPTWRSRRPIGAVLKHCVAQGECAGGHNSGAVTIGAREFGDVYLPLLEGVRGAAGVMAAYNDIDGVPCHANGELFRSILREQVGFRGIVMADGCALDRLNALFGSPERSAAAALAAGVDVSLWDSVYTYLDEAIEQGLVPIDALDRAVYRVLSLKFMLGLFDHPFAEDPGDKLDEVLERSRALNREVARRSMTLVKNDGILPLAQDESPAEKNDAAPCRALRVAVVGPNADEMYNMLGDYTAPQRPDQLERTIFRELRCSMPEAEVRYGRGCPVRSAGSEEGIARAVELAASSDVAILALGGSSARNFDMEFLRNGAVSSRGSNMDCGENVDVASLALGGSQMELAERVAATGTPTVAVLVQGRPYEIERLEQLCSAVLIAWYPGQEGALAIADLLTGAASPSGRLSVTYPRSAEQLPVYYNQRDSMRCENYFDEPGSPLHPFGFGLGYTSFAYEGLRAEVIDGKARVAVTLANVGERPGRETVLLFARLIGGNVLQRERMLRDFRGAELAPGERRELVFELGARAFSYVSASGRDELARRATLMVGPLSCELDLEGLG